MGWLRRFGLIGFSGLILGCIGAWRSILLITEGSQRDLVARQRMASLKRAGTKAISQKKKDEEVWIDWYRKVVSSSKIFEQEECKVWNTVKTVIYNRIPKAASGSVNIFLEAAKEKHGFQTCRSTLYSKRFLEPALLRQFTRQPFTASGCKRSIDLTKPAVLNRHIFFTAFPVQKSVTFVNMIREPTKRCLSRFYYERDARGTILPNITMNHCLSNAVAVTRSGKHCNFHNWQPHHSVASAQGWSRWAQLREECSSNYLSRWFCGHDNQLCSPDAGAFLLSANASQRNDSYTMLHTAMTNIVQAHAAVGLVEHLSDSLRLFRYTLPNFFGSLDDSLLNTVCNKCNPNRTHITNPPPSPENTHLLARINVLDLALYHFAGRLFRARLSNCESSP